MKPQEPDTTVVVARKFLKAFRESSEVELAKQADDLLLFCYRLRDGYSLVRSSNPRFAGTMHGVLQEVIYELESNPDETLLSAQWRSYLQSFLECIATGAIVIAKKQ